MPQLFPNPVSSTQNLTINTTYPLIGGGPVSLGSNITLAVSSSQNSNRNQYTVSPAPNGVMANFTINNTSSSLSVPYADVYINGLVQLTSKYTLTGNVLSFNTPPAIGAVIYAIFALPADQRQMYTLTPATDGTTTIFSFPTTQPFGSYVDTYVGQNMKAVGADYFLNINNGVYTLHFVTAPASGASLVTVFDASVNSGRGQYSVTPAANGTITTFQIIGGSPSSSYIDVFVNGLFKAEGVDYSFQYVSGQWTITFVTAPPSSASIVTIFAPTTVLPSPSSVSSVGLALPSSVFTVTGSPVTTIGTLTGSFTSQAAHTMFAGPTSGTATPAFRTISTADLSDVVSAHTVYAGPTSGTASPTFRVLSTADLSDVANIAFLNVANTFTAAQTVPQITSSKYLAVGTAPTFLVGTHAGTGASMSVTGHDSAGTVNITLGTSPSAGVIGSVFFNSPYSTTPSITITPLGAANSSACQAYVNRSATQMDITAGIAPTGVAGTTVLSFDYHVVGI